MKLSGVRTLILTLAAALLPGAVLAQSEVPIDPALHVYQRASGLNGTIKLNGSDTISQLAAVWVSDFQKLYPDVKIEIDVQGARNAVPAVINGQAQIGMLSRDISEQEVQQFQQKFGYPPTVLTPALESVAVFVQNDNPIASLTLAQLDAIYSSTLKRGAAKQATTWGDVGLTGAWASRPIELHGRSDDTGSQVFFQKGVLGGGQFRQGMIHHASNSELAKAVSGNPAAIGFAGSVHDTPGMKFVPIAWKDGGAPCEPHAVNYPLVRPLQLVVNKDPKQSLGPIEHEFIKFVLSRTGQNAVMVNGFVPVPARHAQVALDAIDAKILH